MIRVRRPRIEDALDERTREKLTSRANEGAVLTPGSKTITSRWDSFRNGKGGDSETGPRVCEQVFSFCRYKCVFCEAPKPKTIDHFWPKTDYPSRMFDWGNLLAACRDCNSEKRTKFSLDRHGNPILIDPTEDEPLSYFRWNERTGKCLYEDTNVRAVETARAIELDRFGAERLHKLKSVQFLFGRCRSEKPVSDELRDRVRDELDESRPYLCILRSYLLYPPRSEDRWLVKEAIRAVPEILEWTRPWLLPPENADWPG